MESKDFDRPKSQSVFLSFVADEFRRRGTPRRKELAQKIISHPFADELGMRVPKRLAVFDNLDELSGEDLPEFFVLKFANGWSARGVMILQRTGNDEFFDHMALQPVTSAQIQRIQGEQSASFDSREPMWIAEEMVRSTLGTGEIPFDYKFYCFRGRVGLVLQIDRNTGPAKMTLFDGTFKPLRRNTDFILSDAARPGIPVIPLHAPEMLWWAQRLSLEADSPFVSIDMLDSPEGPVFGEFTYSPGGTHRKMIRFSTKMLDKLDGLMGESNAYGDVAPAGSPESLRALDNPGLLAYRAWAGYAYNGGRRGAERLHGFYKDLASGSDDSSEAYEWYRSLSARWAGIRDWLGSGKTI